MANLHVIPSRPQFAESAKVTPRQMEVALLAHLSSRDIGLALGISEETVHAHMGAIMRRTGCETRAAVAVWADRLERKAA